MERTWRDRQKQDYARQSVLTKLQQDNMIVAGEASFPRVDAKRRIRIAAEEEKEIKYVFT